MLSRQGAAPPEWGRGVRADPGYYPALDGLRAVAVALVLAFHLGIPGFRAGYLGVDLFFVISGFIITRLLVAEWRRERAIGLRSFWARRAKRLLPALVAVLAFTSSLSLARSPYLNLQGIGAYTAAALFYSENWYLMAASPTSYFSRTYPLPLQHTWSLSVEEQFYLVWPLVLVLMLRSGAGASRSSRNRALWRLAVATAGAGAASAGAMAVMGWAGARVDAIYYNTGCRAFELLAGALLAVLTCSRSPTGKRRALALDAVAAGGFATLVWLLGPSPALFFKGLGAVFVAFCAVLVYSAVFNPLGAVGRALGWRPIAYVGKLSYSLYLWHWPIICLLAPATLGFSGLRLGLLRLGVSVAAAWLSYHLVEAPMRRASYSGALPKAAAVFACGAVLVFSQVSGLMRPSWALSRRAATTTRAAAPVEDPHHPRQVVRIAEVGDSVALQASIAIDAALGSSGGVVDVYNATAPGWGLTAGASWQIVPLGVAKARVQVVLATWTIDNAYIAKNGLPAYLPLLDRFVQGLISAGAQAVVLVEQPPLPPPDAPAALERFPGMSQRGWLGWNEAAQMEAARHPGKVFFFRAASSLEEGGRFAWFLPAPWDTGIKVRARQLDGLHLCPAGAALYAEAVAEQASAELRLPAPAPGWVAGAWRYSTVFDHIPGGQPPGQCPDSGV
jgi:peptidoglycan/LPS O-acetylase OafA/YrhL